MVERYPLPITFSTTRKLRRIIRTADIPESVLLRGRTDITVPFTKILWLENKTAEP